MIGMSQIRKRLIYGILIGAGIGIIGIVITVIIAARTVNSYKNGTNKEYIANYTTEVVMLNRDVVQGETIKEDMLTKARVHKSAAPTDQAGYGAVGKIAKYNIPANIPLINSMFGDNIVSVDERIQEVSSVMLPTGLSEGEYIDIKIKMASGLEYVVIPQIKVQKMSGTTIWLYLDEEELYLLNSAIVDTYLSDGVTLYGVRYVDPTTQIKLDEDAAEKAKIQLAEKIEKDVADGTAAITVPSEVSTQTETNGENAVTASDENTTPVTDNTTTTNETTTTDNTPSQEYVNFSDNLSGLLLKYAIEYRYYVESYNKMTRTYEPSAIVMEHMKANKYITDEAKASLNADIRRQIEEKIEQFKSTSGEQYETAVSGLANQITTQQTLRNSTLTNAAQ